jgi:hypothetical protein
MENNTRSTNKEVLRRKGSADLKAKKENIKKRKQKVT